MTKKTVKPKKAIKPSPEYDSERETRVLLEQVRDQVGIVAEQHGSIVKKLDNYGAEFERINNKLNRIEDKMMKMHIDITANSQKINRVEEKLDSTLNEHDQKIKQIEEKIGV